MKIINCGQRSPVWFSARLGIPTASTMGKLITAKGKERKGATPAAYLLQLLGERLTRTPAKAFATSAMDRGRELEPLAREWYREKTGKHVREVGFVLSGCGRYGCSPDGLGDTRGLEIKCPQLPAFLDYATTGEMPDDYFVQVQASMMICGRALWDFLVFTDVRGLKPMLATIKADFAFQAALSEILARFCDRLDALEAKLREKGNGVPLDTPVDLSALEESTVDMEGIEQ